MEKSRIFAQFWKFVDMKKLPQPHNKFKIFLLSRLESGRQRSGPTHVFRVLRGIDEFINSIILWILSQANSMQAEAAGMLAASIFLGRVPVLCGARCDKCRARVHLGTIYTHLLTKKLNSTDGLSFGTSCDSIVNIQCNPMKVVHSTYTINQGLGSLDSTECWLWNHTMYRKAHTCFLFCCHTICTTAYMEFEQKTCWQTDQMSQNCWFCAT